PETLKTGICRKNLTFTGCLCIKFVVTTRRQILTNVTTINSVWCERFRKHNFQEGLGKHRTMNDLYTIAPSQIVMYTTDYCSDCMRAKKFFEANNIPHLRVGLEGNTEATDFVMKV